MKHNQFKYCQFHKCNTSHYSSECNRNPANMRNSRMAEKDKKEQHQNATINQQQDVNSIHMPENLKLAKFSEISAHFSHLLKMKKSIHQNWLR